MKKEGALKEDEDLLRTGEGRRRTAKTVPYAVYLNHRLFKLVQCP